MKDYDAALSCAKQSATDCLLSLACHQGSQEMAMALDRLNNAWGELTDCLVRQRKERDQHILTLINQVAELKHSCEVIHAAT